MDLGGAGGLGGGGGGASGLSFVGNALLEARHAALAAGLAALAADSGRGVDALGGAPGRFSARYAVGHGDAQANIDKLLDALREVLDERRGAHFHAAIVLLSHAEHPHPPIAEGSQHGRILPPRRRHRELERAPCSERVLHSVQILTVSPTSKEQSDTTNITT